MSAPNKNVPQQQLLKTLEELLKIPENRECADCGTKAPRWASTNLGVFLCIRCAGIHRAMGVHVSKMKSVSLDKWAPSEVEFMQHMGNARGKEIYEAHVPQSYHRGDVNSENIALENWIRDKYERKKFMARDGAERNSERRRDESRGGGGGYQSRDREYEYNRRDQPREREYVREQPREREYVREQPREREYTREQPRDRGYEREQREPVRNTHVSQPPAARTTPTVKQPAAAPAVDLLNWDEPAPASAPAPAPTSAANASLFTSAPTHAASGANGDIFGDFTSAPSSGGAGGMAAAPPTDKNSILMLYHTPPPMTQARPNMPPQMMHQQGPNYNVHMGGPPMPGHMGMMQGNMGPMGPMGNNMGGMGPMGNNMGNMGMRPPGMWGPPAMGGGGGGMYPGQAPNMGSMGNMPPQYNMTSLPGGTMPANFFTPPSNPGMSTSNYSAANVNTHPHNNMNNMMNGLSNLNLRM